MMKDKQSESSCNISSSVIIYHTTVLPAGAACLLVLLPDRFALHQMLYCMWSYLLASQSNYVHKLNDRSMTPSVLMTH